MVNLKSNMMVLNGVTSEVKAWQVWFQTPFGLVADLRTAIQIIEENGLQSEFSIVPVPVCIGSDNLYEVVARM